MNKYILKALVAGASVAFMASCGENSWNDHYLDGFDSGVNYDKSVKGSYTLSEDDYETISKQLEAEAPDSLKAEAKAIASNKFFNKSGAYPAQTAVLALLDTRDFPYYYAPDGSSVDVTFSEAGALPEELTAIAGAQTLTVSTEDYQKIWGSETAFIKAFAPDASAADNLVAILSEKLTAEEGDYAVVTYNEASENPLYGIPAQAEASAELYTASKLEAGKYLMYDKTTGYLSGNLTETQNYGYLPSSEITANGNTISGFNTATAVWEFESAGAEGEFYIKDGLGRYYYQSGTYNSFNVSADTDGDGYVWVVTSEADNTWKILNKGVSKWIQGPSGTYTTWGSYNYDNGKLPSLYTIAEAGEPVEIPLVTPSYATVNAVYYYNGTKWAEATGVMALNPADYTAMGVANNKLTDPATYIPMYLRNRKPYAMQGDMEYVVYNGTHVDLFVYDGSTWTLNNNSLETVTARFTRTAGEWKFVKYMGKATFVLFDEQQLMLDRKYLLVSEGNAAVAVDPTASYSYLLTTAVSVGDDGQIVLPSDENAYLFATSYTADGVTVKADEGQFMIVSADNKYLYLKGTYSSANLSDAPTVTDGKIEDGYLWTAENNGDGTWSLVSVLNGRKWFFSSKYKNFAAYETQSDVDFYPQLFMLDGE